MDPRTRRAVGHILLLRMRPCRGSLFFGAQLPWRLYNVSSLTHPYFEHSTLQLNFTLRGPLVKLPFEYSSRQHKALASGRACKR